MVREAWFYIGAVVVAALVVHNTANWVYAAPLWALVALLAYLFRDPDREIPPLPLAVVSPADGRVDSVDDCRDPYLERRARCISVRMAWLGTYVTRSPVEGKVQERWHTALGGEGSNVSSGLRYGVWIRTDEEDDVVFVMNRASPLKSPRCYVHSGERVGQGQRCGFVRFGTRIDVYLPEGARVEVAEGDRVHAGTDVIATLLRK